MIVRYVLSDTYDYAHQILGDAGPRFAADYQWPTLSMRDMEAHAAPGVFIIDSWLDEAECSRLEAIVRRRDDSLFVLHVVDPWPHIAGSPLYKLATRISARRNFAISSTYHLSENWSSIWSKTDWPPILTPYLYDRTKERPLSHAGRTARIILTGNIGASDYPVRADANAHRLFNPMFWFSFDRLKHPGYFLNRGSDKQRYVGDAFVELLSRYKFAFVCSSRNRLEFLKYREIAYAGCVPVGDLPGTLQDCPPNAYVHWRRNFIRTWQELRRGGTEERAKTFRAFMAQARDPIYWRARVLSQLETLFDAHQRSRPASPETLARSAV